jgi:predicted phage tail protein
MTAAISGAKKGGGTPYTPREAPDSLRAKSIARFLLLIAGGQTAGLVDGLKSVYFDGTPVENADGSRNFEGVTIQTRLGSSAQRPIGDLDAVESEEAVDVEVEATAPVTRTITDPAIDAIGVTLRVGPFYFQSTQGDLIETEVEVAIDVSVDGGAFVERTRDTIAGKTMSVYDRRYVIEVSGATTSYTVRVRRITAEPENSQTQNTLRWLSRTTILRARLIYPDCSLALVEADAAQFGTRIPGIGLDWRLALIRVPSNYDPVARTYHGLWDGRFKWAHSDNPAWCLFHLLVDPLDGAGLNADRFDRAAFYVIGQRCDELVPDGLGGMEPRFRLNCYITSRERAFDLITKLAGAFGCMPYWGAGRVKLVQDMPSDPVKIITPANVVGGEITYEGTDREARHTACIVRWNDPSDGYAAAFEVVEDREAIARYGWRQTEVVAIGCTSRGQAARAGREVIESNQSETQTASWLEALDAFDLEPGAIVQVADPSIAGIRQGGRIRSADGLVVTLDAPAQLAEGTAYTLTVVGADGVLQSRPVTSPAGLAQQIGIATAFSPAPVAGAMFVLASTTLAPRLFRVLAVAEERGQYQITALAHDPGKRARIERGIDLPVTPWTLGVPRGRLAAPSDLALLEYLFRPQGAGVATGAQLSWRPVRDARVTGYEVEVAEGDVSATRWRALGLTSAPSIDWRPLVEGRWIAFRVRSQGFGRTSFWSTLPARRVVGKTAPPAAPALVQFRAAAAGGVLSWTPSAELDVVAYHVRRGPSWDGAEQLARLAGSELTLAAWQVGETKLMVAAEDDGGRVGPATETLVSIVGPQAPALLLDWRREQLRIRVAATPGTWPIERFEIQRGGTEVAPDEAWAGLEALRMVPVTWTGAQVIRARAVDVAGNASPWVEERAEPAAPAQPQGLSAQVIDNAVLLRWEPSVRGTFAVQHYEVRRGSVWVTAEVVGEAAGTFVAIQEQAPGLITYMVAAVDRAGNGGTPAAVTARVDEPPDFVLVANRTSTWSGTRSNALVVDGKLLAPALPAETWQDRATMRGWASPQAQVNAGFPRYFQPTLSPASYVETFDFGATIAVATVTVDLMAETITGTVVAACQLETSTDGIAWTALAAGFSQVARAFRHLRVTLTFTASDQVSASWFGPLRIRAKLKRRRLAGKSTVTSAAAGRVVTFAELGIAPADVLAITATPRETSARQAVVDFVDTPDPTSFTVRLFNASGTAQTGGFSFVVEYV